jgi:hypothetical protein
VAEDEGEALALRLAVAYAELCAEWSTDGDDHADLIAEGSSAVMKWVAERVVWGMPDPWAISVLWHVERTLETRNPSVGDFIGWNLIEYVQHAASHTDSPVTPAALREELGPMTRSAWDQVDWFWGVVASESTGEAPIGDSQYAGITNAALRSLVRTSFRRMSDGRWVGVTDALAYELRHKVRPPTIVLPPASD